MKWHWCDKYGDEGGDAELCGPDGVAVLEAACSTDEINPYVRRLTESAPDLLDTLRKLVNAWESDYHCCRNSILSLGGHDSECSLAEASAMLKRFA